MDFQGKRVLVVGLARSGLAVARALARRGAVVTVTDNKPPAHFRDVLPELLKDKVGLELGSQREETFLRNQMIVTSPGVPWDLPQLEAARAKKIAIYPEVEVASWFLDGTIIGITGSNGKTTTTSLLGDMLRASGFPTFVGGNIGNALSSAVDNSEPATKFVTELSSFQLEGIQAFKPHVAVLLNLSPNHLDRHPTFEAYGNAKRQIFRNQDHRDFAVLNADDAWVSSQHASIASKSVMFSRQRELPSGVFAVGGKVYYRTHHLERVLFETRDITLKGDFNLEDVLAATAAACLVGADFAAIRKAVREFKAVEHRLEFVREIKGVDFYNNSKATSVDATLKSLEAFERGVHLIIGGKDKGAPYTPLIPLIRERVRDVLVIGAAAPIITEQLSGSAELIQAGDLETAVHEAFARARPSDTVLLAPACSSFDQFKDYEERGRVFKNLVHKLASETAGGKLERPKLSSLPRTPAPIAHEVIVPPALNASFALPAPPAEVTSQPPVGVQTSASSERPPVVDLSAEERRSAARKRAREMASARGWKVDSKPSSEVAATSREVERASEPPSPLEAVELHPIAPSLPHGKEATIDRIIVNEDVPLATISADEPKRAKPEPAIEVPTPAKDERKGIEFAPEPVPGIGEQEPNSASKREEERGPKEREKVTATESMPGKEAVRLPANLEKPSTKRETVQPNSAIAEPHRMELTYVYEVGAVEMLGSESQTITDDEPEIILSRTVRESLDDEIMPFEARPQSKKKTEGRRSKIESKGQPKSPKFEDSNAGAGDPKSSAQTDLFDPKKT